MARTFVFVFCVVLVASAGGIFAQSSPFSFPDSDGGGMGNFFGMPTIEPIFARDTETNFSASGREGNIPDSGMSSRTGITSGLLSKIAPWFSLPELYWKNPVDITTSLRMGYDSNVHSRKNDIEASPYANFIIGGKYKFGNRRLSVDISFDASTRYYSQLPQGKYYNGDFNINMAYGLTPRTSLTFSNTTRYVSDNDFYTQGADTNFVKDYVYQNIGGSVIHSMHPRWISSTSYSYTGYQYNDKEYNDSNGRQVYNATQTFRHLLKPRTSVTINYTYSYYGYMDPDRYSHGNLVYFGLDHVFTSRLKTSIAGGGEYRINASPGTENSSYFGPFFQGSISYRFGPRSDLSFNVRYGSESADTSSSSQVTTLRGGLNINHYFSNRLSATMGVAYQNRNYALRNTSSDSYVNTDYYFNLSGKFKVNRYLFIESGYNFSSSKSDRNVDDGYGRNVFYFGGGISL